MILHEEQGHITPLQRLLTEDALGQLRRREGRMAELGSEDGVLKLDWVEGVARLLDDSTQLETVEAEARAIWEQGMRHIIWAGMGGSVITVRVLVELGFGDGQDERFITIHPLDSTDPAALNAIVRTLAQRKNLVLPNSSLDKTLLYTLLEDVMMIGVSMGMTSEEPITHLEWFTALLEQAQLQPSQHLLIMTLPGSYLDAFAKQHQVPTRPLQLDGGTGTGGRMSAPTTRVFLLPAALYLTRLSPATGLLRHVLQQAWQHHNLATPQPTTSPFVQLAAALSEASSEGACRVLIAMPEGWQPLVQWVEQLMEESLGKGGKGVVVFDEQWLNTQAPNYRPDGTLSIQVITEHAQPAHDTRFHLYQPYLASQEPRERLAALVASFLGWQLSMALYGYLHAITFAGQPAVENYKALARILRNENDPLQVLANWPAKAVYGSLTLFAPHDADATSSLSALFAAAFIGRTQQKERVDYLDCTFNGIMPQHIQVVFDTYIHIIGNRLLGVPVKIRQAPADYHSTEQSEMDGPPYLVSLRILVRTHETSILGTYPDTFLCAQAISTWQAMIEQGRRCYLLLIDDDTDNVVSLLTSFFEDVEQQIREM
ncbi:MAG: hypothetical protein NVS4B11_26950 [Ktedonobacteraceae bacterium]